MEISGVRSWWIKVTIIVMAMFLFIVPAKKVYAEGRSGTCGDNLTWSLSDDETVLTISGSGEMGHYSFRQNLAPWSEGDNEGGNSKITQVILPEGLVNIGSCAFYDCRSLTSINIPDSVTSIEGSAFSHCVSLTSINIPDSITSIEYNVFDNCCSLTSITIPDSIISIKSQAFLNCVNLTSITIPNSVTSIESQTFWGCASLVDVTISDSVTSIGKGAFSGCARLTTINIPKSVTSIGEGAFSDCERLASINIPISVTSIGEGAFNSTKGTIDYVYKDVYYEGTEEQWNDIYMGLDKGLSDALIHYQGEPRDLQWKEVDGKYYWYEDNARQGTEADPKCFEYEGTKRGREIYDPVSNGWYWLDAIYYGAKAVGKEVFMPYIYQNEKDWKNEKTVDNAAASGANAEGNIEHAEMADQVLNAIRLGTGKWVRYDENGKMIKGWVTIEGELATLYPDQAGNKYYYDHKTGLMAKGWIRIGEKIYYFDEMTGTMAKGDLTINRVKYHFNENDGFCDYCETSLDSLSVFSPYEALRLINEDREAAGVAPLTMNDEYRTAAQAMADSKSRGDQYHFDWSWSGSVYASFSTFYSKDAEEFVSYLKKYYWSEFMDPNTTTFGFGFTAGENNAWTICRPRAY